MFCMLKKRKIYPAHVSKSNSNHEAKSKGRQWHFLAIKKLSALLRGRTFQYSGDFYCLTCFRSFRIKSKLESHKKVCEKKDFVM